ncbi:MAG: enoyl-CoA hydratase/isomerase family protein [Candidatus Lokiarchaeota archaeon]|nr:enoyl-CoA hydratase/isomerase family protein [Candidatus Lokiarchaeota archaeon]
MEYKDLIIEKRDDQIAIVTFNRPEQLNTLTTNLMTEIEQLTEDFQKDTETRVVIFTGAGRFFSGGRDLTEQGGPATVLGRQRAIQNGPRMIYKLYNMDQITIAAINGGAFGGGCCIASALDFRIGDDKCRAGFPESRLGMSLSWRILPIVVHLIGPTFAKEMTILGKNNEAQTLLKWGFLNEVVPKEDLLARAIEIAKDYAAMPPIPAQMIKKTINHITGALDQAIMHMDMDQLMLTLQTDDLKEGVAAFFGKRDGKFKGN